MSGLVTFNCLWWMDYGRQVYTSQLDTHIYIKSRNNIKPFLLPLYALRLWIMKKLTCLVHFFFLVNNEVWGIGQTS